MSATGLDVFDKTLQTTHTWLDEIMEEVGPDRQLAWKVLSSVLHALRDRLPVELAAHLGAELPLLVRGTYYDQYRPERQPTDWNLEEFVAAVSAGLRGARPTDPTDAIRAVFAVLSRHLPAGQVNKVRLALPDKVQDLWNAAERQMSAA